MVMQMAQFNLGEHVVDTASRFHGIITEISEKLGQEHRSICVTALSTGTTYAEQWFPEPRLEYLSVRKGQK